MYLQYTQLFKNSTKYMYLYAHKYINMYYYVLTGIADNNKGVLTFSPE